MQVTVDHTSHKKGVPGTCPKSYSKARIITAVIFFDVDRWTSGPKVVIPHPALARSRASVEDPGSEPMQGESVMFDDAANRMTSQCCWEFPLAG